MLWVENYYELTILCPLNYNLENSKIAKFDKTIVALLSLILLFKNKNYVNEHYIVETLIELIMLYNNFNVQF